MNQIEQDAAIKELDSRLTASLVRQINALQALERRTLDGLEKLTVLHEHALTLHRDTGDRLKRLESFP